MPRTAGARERVLNCRHAVTEAEAGAALRGVTLTTCVHASPNPEFAASPKNFAHFVLAHLFPLVRASREVGVQDPFDSNLFLWHGANRIFARWAPSYIDLLGAGANCSLMLTQRVQTPADLLERQREHSCGAFVPTIAVRQWSFRNHSFFEASANDWRYFSHVMRSRFLRTPPPRAVASPDARARLVVMLRRGTRTVEGLEQACNEAWAERALNGLHVSVHCTTLGNASQALSRAAHALGDAVGLVAGHGSGLATLPFLPQGARFAEVDSIRNAVRARNMYIYLAHALGLVATKVWLNESGARFCPRRVVGCTSSGGGASIHGCAVGYTGNTTISEGVLIDVLRAAAVGSPSAGVDCGVEADGGRPKRWFDVSAEMRRPWQAPLTAVAPYA